MHISDITKVIADLKKILDSNDVSLVSAYKPKNAEFKKLPPTGSISFPSFTPHQINKEQIYHQFSTLTASSIKIEEKYTKKSQDADYSPLDTQLIDVPRIITEIDTNNGDSNRLRCIPCVSDNEVWTCGLDSIMRLFNLQGKLVKSIQSKSGRTPSNLEVTRNNNLVYTDYDDKTVNIVQNTQIQTVIKLQGWKPRCVCSTSTGDLLVLMDSDDAKETKVVRYSSSPKKQKAQCKDKGKPLLSGGLFSVTIRGFVDNDSRDISYTGPTGKQSIQYNDEGQPLYSPGGYKYINENRNLDICVSDNGARSVVVLNKTGKLRFIYSGPSPISKRSFSPHGLTSDSNGRILIADWHSQSIHILDQDGQFLRKIDNFHLNDPLSLCLDGMDNLFVAEWTGRMKKIKYQQIVYTYINMLRATPGKPVTWYYGTCNRLQNQ